MDKEKQQEKVRAIIETAAVNARWLPVPDPFPMGGKMGFTFGDTDVAAVIEWDDFQVKVKMISPVEIVRVKEIYYRQQTFFRRNLPGASLFKDGAASERCVKEAGRLLVDMFTDWYLLQCNRESIADRLRSFRKLADELHVRETERLAAIRERLSELYQNSARLKHRLKSGELSQQEYRERRKPIHDEIVSLVGQSEEKDAFREIFRDEYELCGRSDNPLRMIESVGGIRIVRRDGNN